MYVAINKFHDNTFSIDQIPKIVYEILASIIREIGICPLFSTSKVAK